MFISGLLAGDSFTRPSDGTSRILALKLDYSTLLDAMLEAHKNSDVVLTEPLTHTSLSLELSPKRAVLLFMYSRMIYTRDRIFASGPLRRDLRVITEYGWYFVVNSERNRWATRTNLWVFCAVRVIGRYVEVPNAVS